MKLASGSQEDPRGIAIARRRFTLVDQEAFTAFSGDHNPVHLDPIAARRTIAGSVVVHGVNALLWALESYLRAGYEVPGRLNVNFKKPIFLEEEVVCRYLSARQMISIWLDDARLVDILMAPGAVDKDAPFSPEGERAEEPAVLTEMNLGDAQTFPLKLRGDPSCAAALYPVSCEKLGAARVSDLAATSEIVGMRAPGLHSLYLSLKADFGQQDQVETPRYTVEAFDPRFRMVNVTVETASLSARLTALLRPPPAEIPSSGEPALDVAPDAFKKTNALIIGGSRGLGEATAKIISRGGGAVTLTYRTGSEDAERVVRDITEHGGRARAIQLDVLEREQIAGIVTRDINQLYYFATPKIFGKRGTAFDPDLLERFRSYYVEAFEALVRRVLANQPAFATFYPSTSALDESLPELAEYSRAKDEGEDICAKLSEAPGHKVLCPRIPRTHTDQTAALVSVPACDPLDIMLPFVREMNAHTVGVDSKSEPGA